MAVKAVLFDVGNTLVQEYEDWRELEQKGVLQLIAALQNHGVDFNELTFSNTLLSIREESFRKAKETAKEVSAFQSLTQALWDLGIHEVDNELINRGVEAFFRPQEAVASLLSGVPETLRILSHRGYTLGVISNATSSLSVRRVLEKHGILHWFTTVIISADVGFRKPRKEIFDIALSQMRIRADQAIYVGNARVYDVNGASGAGLKTILLDNSSTEEKAEGDVEPDFTISDLEEVPEIVRET